jgi:hypothetical protein
LPFAASRGWVDVEAKLAMLRVDQIRKCALHLRGMASIALTIEARAELDRLADRCEAIARGREAYRPNCLGGCQADC